MKITNRQLQETFDRARDVLVNESAEGLNSQQFVAKCWIEAVAGLLNPGVQLEYEKRVIVEPVEE